MPLITLRNSSSNNTITVRSEDIRYAGRNHTAWPAFTAIRVGDRGTLYEVVETPEEIQALIAKASAPTPLPTPLPPNIIQSIKNWFDTAVPAPTPLNCSVQLGCHVEEFAEMAEAIGWPALQEQLTVRADHLKAGKGVQLSIDGKALLDALCDQIVTAVGVAHMFDLDIIRALDEVNRSNWSKFDENGKPLFDENGKIKKGPNYKAPDLTGMY